MILCFFTKLKEKFLLPLMHCLVRWLFQRENAALETPVGRPLKLLLLMQPSNARHNDTYQRKSA
jgi:hypothetical protein